MAYHAEMDSETPTAVLCVIDVLAASNFFRHELDKKPRRGLKAEYSQFQGQKKKKKKRLKMETLEFCLSKFRHLTAGDCPVLLPGCKWQLGLG